MTDEVEDWRAKATANIRSAGGRRGRLLFTKSRSGCNTCKAHRVKCDEGLPKCGNCLRTGRQCEGYATAAHTVLGRGSLASHRPLVPGFTLNPVELRAMEYFSTCTAIRIGGWLDAGFWQHDVMRLCHTEPFALNAAMAISTFCQIWTHGTGQDNGSCNQALYFYNKAIRATRLKIQHEGLQPALAVTSCALFVCIEFLRDNITAARSLIVQGIQLLRSLVVDRSQQPHVAFFRDLLIRLNVLAATFGDSNAANIELEVNTTRSIVFESVAEARSSLFAIMAESHPFLKDAMAWRTAALESGDFSLNKGTDLEKMTSMSAWQSTVRQSLDDWYTTFTTRSPQLASSPIDSKSLLCMYYHTSRAWLFAQLDLTQSAFDSLTPDFEQAIHHAEIYVNARAAENTHLTFEFGAVPILYFVAIRCRMPTLRREALALLAKAPRKENIYNAESSADLAARIIAFEEGGLGLPDPRLSGVEAFGFRMNARWPAESKRAHVLQAAERRSPNGGKMSITRYAVDDQGGRRRVEEDIGG